MTKKFWSHSVGIRRKNRIRAFEHESGMLFIEFSDNGKRTRISLGHRNKDRAIRQATAASKKLSLEEDRIDQMDAIQSPTQEKNFIVYAHFHPGQIEPFYIGQGRVGRHNKKSGRTKEWTAAVEKFGFESRVLFKDLTKADAIKKEIELISKYKLVTEGGCLVNKTYY